MRTATSALFIALCILFAATYATALRRGPGHRHLRKNVPHRRHHRHVKQAESLADIYKQVPDWARPTPTFPTRPILLSDAEKSFWKKIKVDKVLKGLGQAAGAANNINTIKSLFLSDAEAEIRAPDWTRPSPTFPGPRGGPVYFSDSEIVAPTGPHRPWGGRRGGPIMYSDAEIVAPTGPHRPWRRNGPIMYSDAEIIGRPDWTRPSPFNPTGPYTTYSDAELSIIDRDWVKPSPYNPYPVRPVLFSDAEYRPAPTVYTTVPIRPKFELYDDLDLEEYDEEDWSVNGTVSNGGNWNLGTSYSNNGFTGSASVGNGGQWNVGGSYTNGGFTGGVNAGNNGQWSANAGYNTNLGGGNLNVGGQVSNGGNWGVGVGYTLRF